MAEKILMKLQDERNDIVRQYKRHEIRSKDAIGLLKENEKKMTEAKRQYEKAKKTRWGKRANTALLFEGR